MNAVTVWCFRDEKSVDWPPPAQWIAWGWPCIALHALLYTVVTATVVGVVTMINEVRLGMGQRNPHPPKA